MEEFIDADPDDEWELNEGKDYKVVNDLGLREYTETGAFAIAGCLEHQRSAQKGWFQKLIQKLIQTTKGDIRKVFVQQKILNNSSSLVQNNDLYFLSTADVVAIFETRPDYLRKISELAKRSDKTILVKNEDYLDLMDKGIYYSLSGLVKLAKVFAQELTQKNRRIWCGDVGENINIYVKDILKQIESRNDAIENAIKQAKTKAGRKCQVTGVKGDKIQKVPMAGHHLYSKAEYPHLAACVDNIICIANDLHNDFHQYMGGFDKPCTLDDFVTFIKCYYPEQTAVLTWLQAKKLILGTPQQDITKHVLQLSWPIPQLALPPAQ
ncbi:MAG: hypothetical protein KME35_01785 [Aphanocapsa sp. GSE-SYN-MK-11-07L]|nr:hypothetical protein [Aphanocapsa sp. GSE-SYN-MK-11-07L]